MSTDSAVEDGPSDDVLVARAQQGDTVAFGALVRRYADRLYVVIMRLTGDAQDAEDALQETFLRAWRNIGRFEHRATFFTWLYRIGINEGKRRVERQSSRARQDPIEDHVELETTDRTSLPGAGAELGELRGALERAIGALPADQRLPLILRDIEGLDTKEASGIMDLSEAAFKSRLHRARMAVRESVEPYLSEPSSGDEGSNL